MPSVLLELLILVFFGATIGYVTNYLAIRALFRPRRPIKLFGWKLPLTPGLIPSRQPEIADAIAKIINQKLVTEERIQSRIEQAIDEQLNHWMEPRNFFKNSLGNVMSRLLEAGFSDLKPRLKRAIRTPLSRRVTRMVQHYLDAGEISRRQLNELDMEQFESIILSIARRELRWICWLGAIIGGLVGIGQYGLLLLL